MNETWFLIFNLKSVLRSVLRGGGAFIPHPPTLIKLSRFGKNKIPHKKIKKSESDWTPIDEILQKFKDICIYKVKNSSVQLNYCAQSSVFWVYLCHCIRSV